VRTHTTAESGASPDPDQDQKQQQPAKDDAGRNREALLKWNTLILENLFHGAIKHPGKSST
jgi:hypothetical protein